MGKAAILTGFYIVSTVLALLAGQPATTYLEKKVREAYLNLAKAEEKGANVSEAALKLNKALQLLRLAKHEENPEKREEMLKEAEKLILEVEKLTPKLAREGEVKETIRKITSAFTAVAASAALVLAYLYLPRLLWRLWVKARSNWRVVKT